MKITASIGVSAARNGRSAGLGNACPIFIPRCCTASAPRRRRSAGLSARCSSTSILETPCRACSSCNLPGGAFLGILDNDAHRRKLVPDAVGLPEVLARAGRGAGGNQIVNLFGVDAAGLLLAAFPLRGTFGEKSEKPQGSRECAAISCICS